MCGNCGERQLITGEDERRGLCAACRTKVGSASTQTARWGCAICGAQAGDVPKGGRAVCTKCQEGYGLPAKLPPSRRPAKPCRRCSSHTLLRSFLRERAARGGDYVHAYAAPLGVGFAQGERTKGLFNPRTVPSDKADLGAPFGLLEAWVCRGCGFTELYALNPEEIPVGPEHGTELVVIEESGYRS